MKYAGIWVQFIAVLVDLAIIGSVYPFLIILFTVLIANGIITEQNMGITAFTATVNTFIIVQVISTGLYFTALNAKFGKTVGKKICGIKVVDIRGNKIGYLQSLARFVLEFMSISFFLLGYIVAVFDQEKITFHDRVCRTRVIYS